MSRALLLLAVLVTLLSSCLLQSEECARYVECQAAYDEAFDIAPGQGGVDTSRWKQGGACWSSVPAADDCTADCVEATAQLAAAAQEADVDLAACSGG